MSLWRSDPERAAEALVLDRLDEIHDRLPVGGPLLCVNTSRAVVDAFHGGGVATTIWHRRWTDWAPANLLPQIDAGAPPRAALIRLPKDKNELGWLMDIVLRELPVGAPVLIYGGNDEGIRSIPRRLTERYGATVSTLTAHGHGRVAMLPCPAVIADPLPEPSGTIVLGDGAPRAWVSYPGLFADGALDAGTALLLQHLPKLEPAAVVLDYGCGTGVIARAVLDRDPTAKLVLMDNDTAALFAARQNLPSTQRYVLGNDLGILTDKTAPEWRRLPLSTPTMFDLIISNPPIHSGIREDHGALDRLISDAPRHLRPGGRLVMVVQRRIVLERQLAAAFKVVQVIADDGRFRVWSAMVA